MKAIYKQHQGFEHLSSLSMLNYTSNLPPPKSTNEVDDTSTKKYAHCKYYQFNDEDSSGRKYLKEKLNLYSDEDGNSSGTSARRQEPACEKENYSICINGAQLNKYENMKTGNTHELPTGKEWSSKSVTPQYHKPKTQKIVINRSANKSAKNATRSKHKCKKVSASVSTVESKCNTRTNANSSRHRVAEKEGAGGDGFRAEISQLRHYKKLCLDMRKKNCELNRQLEDCREHNRKSIHELQRKVEKISEKYLQSKENLDNTKTQKIMQSLKAIKGKLSKKENSSQKQQQKFYKFFVQSLGILQNEGEQKPQKYSALEIQMMWKHMLQFLITHDYKIDPIFKPKSIR